MSYLSGEAKATREMDLRSFFLEDSARLLRVSSSSTAAHLMSERIQMLIPGHKISLKELRQTTCIACGALRNFELSQIVPESGLKKRNQNLIQYSNSKSTTCPRCRRSTVTNKTCTSKPLHASNSAKSVTNKTPDTSSLAAKSGSVAKLKSKQRAKLRKEKTGLQALLAKTQETEAGPAPLSLLDLMQTSGS